MATVQYRIEQNHLTHPTSYRLRFLPKQIAGYDEVAARVALKNPGSSPEQIRNHLRSAFAEIEAMLAEGMQVTLEETLTICPAFHARLSNPDDPLPPMEELFRLSISATRPFVRAVRDAVTLERVSHEEKAPSILSAADKVLDLNNVLNPEGVLQLIGSHLSFDRNASDCRCVIAGTRSGSRVQSRFAAISDSEILLVPHIPAQADLWNNEYTVSVTTRYTEHGVLRTGTYGRRLRTPLRVNIAAPGGTGTGILTGSADAPYVSVIGGSISANERLRIRVDHNLQEDRLSFSLRGLLNDSASGPVTPVTGNGDYTLPGFASSAVSALHIRVNNYDDLKAMVRNDYNGTLVDILDVAELDFP